MGTEMDAVPVDGDGHTHAADAGAVLLAVEAQPCGTHLVELRQKRLRLTGVLAGAPAAWGDGA
jgi:hypothetical protein